MPILGRGSPHGRGSPAAEFEEAIARAREVSQRADARHGVEVGDRTRSVLAWLASGLAIAVMTYAIWSIFGTVAGLFGGLLLVGGALVLWRLWS